VPRGRLVKLPTVAGDVGGLGHEALDDRQDLAEHRLGQHAGREAAPGPFGGDAGVALTAGQAP